MKNASIISYGSYIPRLRIITSEISRVWGKDEKDIIKSLGVRQKSVAGFDEDAVTMAFEAALEAVMNSGFKSSEVEACLVGSESRPYAVNPTSTIVAQFLGLGHQIFASDFEFACKAGTSAMATLMAMIESERISLGLAIGTDKAQAKPHDILEYTAASASCALLLGKDNSDSIARIIDFVSYSSDTPDFWRRDGVKYPSHGGRFTGEPAYFSHVLGSSKNLLEKGGFKPSDFTWCVFHMPNGKFPRDAAKRLGFTREQLVPSLIFDDIGNPYTASSMLGLTAVLDIAGPDELIFFVSYGSGAGSDAFIIKTSKNIKKSTAKIQSYKSKIQNTKNISYVEYLKLLGKI